MFRILLLLCIVIFQYFSLKSQGCTPPSADKCSDATVLCSLDELNGYSCLTLDYLNPTSCLPCNGQSKAWNSSWWAFVAPASQIEITLIIGNCTNPNNGTSGMKIGINGDCSCNETIICKTECNNQNSSITIITNQLTPCKTYYLWVDGCNGDICEFSFSIDAGLPIDLQPLKMHTSQIGSLCKGCCADFWVEPQMLPCTPLYTWTIDGDEIISDTSNKANLCFPNEGTFTVCVEGIVGKKSIGLYCSSQIKCMNFNVAKKKDVIAMPLTLCQEDLPYRWYCHSITTSGQYRCTFYENICCEHDTVIQVNVIPAIAKPTVNYIGCENEVYIDSTTMTAYPNCIYNQEITLHKSSSIHHCDSSYILNTYYPRFTSNFQYICDSGKLQIKAIPVDLSPNCGHNVVSEISYRWYNKQKFDSTIIAQNTLTIVDSAVYCMELSVLTKLGNVEKICKFNTCEQTSEDLFLTITWIQGEDNPDYKKIEDYYFPTITFPIKKHEWRVEGGILLDSLSTPSRPNLIFVKWLEGSDSIGKVCLKITTDCYETKEYCKLIKLRQKTSIDDHHNPEFIQIYPNPNNGTFSIINKSNMEINRFKIYNANGKDINFTSKKTNDATTIDLKTKASGIYYLQLNTSQGIIHKKIMISN
ncbi:MAG: T9SS type A sorting domain-containing protein [Saprospiraceae bacterium]